MIKSEPSPLLYVPVRNITKYEVFRRFILVVYSTCFVPKAWRMRYETLAELRVFE